MRSSIGRVAFVGAALGVIVLTTAAGAGAAPTYPKFSAPVVDAAGVVPNNVETAVNAQLNSYQQRTGNQVAVAVVKTTGGESIENYARQLFNQWGVGRRATNNGVLLVIEYDDHKLRIEIGDGLTSELSDSVAAQIVADDIVPMMRANNVASAIDLGTDAIRQALGDPLAQPDVGAPELPSSDVQTTPSSSHSGVGSLVLVTFVALFVVFAIVGAIAGAGRRGYRSPSVWGPTYGYYGRPRGFRGWGGGGFWGGFSGGGGGSSSGGGASGSW